MLGFGAVRVICRTRTGICSEPPGYAGTDLAGSHDVYAGINHKGSKYLEIREDDDDLLYIGYGKSRLATVHRRNALIINN